MTAAQVTMLVCERRSECGVLKSNSSSLWLESVRLLPLPPPLVTVWLDGVRLTQGQAQSPLDRNLLQKSADKQNLCAPMVGKGLSR